MKFVSGRPGRVSSAFLQGIPDEVLHDICTEYCLFSFLLRKGKESLDLLFSQQKEVKPLGEYMWWHAFLNTTLDPNSPALESWERRYEEDIAKWAERFNLSVDELKTVVENASGPCEVLISPEDGINYGHRKVNFHLHFPNFELNPYTPSKPFIEIKRSRTERNPFLDKDQEDLLDRLPGPTWEVLSDLCFKYGEASVIAYRNSVDQLHVLSRDTCTLSIVLIDCVEASVNEIISDVAHLF